ncbi:MAG: toprim domain-containing protein, partial [Chromatiaceae bacterium]
HRVWEQTVESDAQEAEPLRRYLLRRGIEAVPDPGVVRFHPALGYFEDRVRRGTYPAMIARVTNVQGGLVSLHRTYLTREGRKAPVEFQKKTMMPCGPMQGGAIRLFPAGPEIGIAEGIETALAVRQRTGMPVWAALSATLLERWEPPADVRLVVIWADLDRSGAGAAAANRLRDRLLAQGLQVALHLPAGPIPEGQKGLDWADLWRLRLRSAA